MYPSTISSTGAQAIPAVGLGLWKVASGDAPSLVVDAIAAGYRHFDSASDYGNEPAVGEGLSIAIRQGLCRREELWITSKLWNSNHAPAHVGPALRQSLRDLRLEYLDLYLIHFPIAQRYVPPETRYPAGWFFDPDAANPRMELAAVPLADTWRAMEEVQRAGLVRHIGVSNFGTALMRDLLSYASIRPAVLQVELHPLLAQQKLVRFCRESSVAVTAFSPLGAPSYIPLSMAAPEESLLEHQLVRSIAARCHKSPGQVLLRWGVQRGTSVVCKTSRPERLKENLEVLDFQLAPEEMDALSALDCGRRFNDPGVFCEAAFNTFCPIFD